MTNLTYPNDNSFTKPEIENIEKSRIEHTLIGTFNRTKGLCLFAYNILNQELHVVAEIFEGDLYLIRDADGKMATKKVGHTRVYVNPANEHFEALNLKNAQKRVDKYRAGKIKSLNNMKEPKNNTIIL